MPVDLETQLRDYGPVLDRAAEHGGDVVVLRQRTHRPSPARRRTRLLALSAAAIAAATALTGTLLSMRRPEVAHAPTATVAGSGPGVDAEPVSVRLADGLVPWYVLAPDDASSFEPLVGEVEVACSDWIMAGDEVECLSVVSRPFRPQVGYADGGRSVTISAVHSRTLTAEKYSAEYAERFPLDPIGTMTTPVELSDGRSAIHTSGNDDSDQRLTFAVAPGTFVSLTARELTREELLGFAARLVPVEDVPQLPLLLAVADHWRHQPSGAPQWLLGGVSGGEVCAFGTEPVFVGTIPQCRRIGSDQVLLVDAGTAGVYSGLVGADVEFLRLTFEDRSEPWGRPTPQPIGEVQAFLIDHPGPQAIALAALDEHTQELRVVDVRRASGTDREPGTLTLGAPAACGDDTVVTGDTPARIAERYGISLEALNAANPDLLASFEVGATVHIPCPVG